MEELCPSISDADVTGDLPAFRPSLPLWDDDSPPPYLVVLREGGSLVVPLAPGKSLLVGRSGAADVQLSEEGVSRLHARVTCTPVGVEVVDLASQNGTRINDAAIRAPWRLSAGDVVGVGAARFVFCGPRAPSKALRQNLPIGAQSIQDRTMQSSYAEIRRLAAADLAVHLQGETGVGKELAARALHAWSKRAAGPFLPVNCAALPDALIESELFGHERGAFSGAIAPHAGLFEAAAGGTILLDEVGELPLSAQAKLLRVIETQRVARVGEVGRERAIDVRILSATNLRLVDEVRAGRFREDLYFRLCGAVVALPPLRERRVEMVTLAQTLLTEASGRPELQLSAAAMQLIVSHPFPGNVRELRNLMSYAAATVPGDRVTASHLYERLRPAERLPMALKLAPSKITFRPIDEEIRDLERSRIRAALEVTGGNRTRAAELISMPRRTFLTKVKLYGLASSAAVEEHDADRG